MIGGRLASLSLSFAALACASGAGGPDAGTTDTTPPSDATLLAQRPYTAAVPAAYTSARTWPLLIVLGGYGDTGKDASAWMGFTALAAVQGLFLVTPDPFTDQTGLLAWNPGPQHAPQFDVEYLRAVIHDLESRYAIDPGRVYVAGHSLGAHMAHRMACDAADDVAAIVSLAGQVTMYAPACAPTRPVSVLQVHGTLDPVIGYGGDVQNDPPDPSVPSAHETVAVWARNDGCTGAIALTGVKRDLDDSLPGSETTVEAYAGCPVGIGVELWSIVGAGHFPHLTAVYPNAAWTFLDGHARH